MKLAKAFAEIDSEDRAPAETTFKGYTAVGSLRGNGSVAISAYEAVVPAREILFHEIRFEVEGGGDYPNEGITTIALEKAELLLASLEALANAKITTDRFELSEVVTSVDDLQIVAFNTGKGRTMAAVTVQTATCHLARQSELLDLHKLVSLAVDHLKRLGSSSA